MSSMVIVYECERWVCVLDATSVLHALEVRLQRGEFRFEFARSLVQRRVLGLEGARGKVRTRNSRQVDIQENERGDNIGIERDEYCQESKQKRNGLKRNAIGID